MPVSPEIIALHKKMYPGAIILDIDNPRSFRPIHLTPEQTDRMTASLQRWKEFSGHGIWVLTKDMVHSSRTTAGRERILDALEKTPSMCTTVFQFVGEQIDEQAKEAILRSIQNLPGVLSLSGHSS